MTPSPPLLGVGFHSGGLDSYPAFVAGLLNILVKLGLINLSPETHAVELPTP